MREPPMRGSSPACLNTQYTSPEQSNLLGPSAPKTYAEPTVSMVSRTTTSCGSAATATGTLLTAGATRAIASAIATMAGAGRFAGPLRSACAAKFVLMIETPSTGVSAGRKILAQRPKNAAA